MDFNPTAKPQSLVIRGNNIHVVRHHSFGPLVVDA